MLFKNSIKILFSNFFFIYLVLDFVENRVYYFSIIHMLLGLTAKVYFLPGVKSDSSGIDLYVKSGEGLNTIDSIAGLKYTDKYGNGFDYVNSVKAFTYEYKTKVDRDNATITDIAFSITSTI